MDKINDKPPSMHGTLENLDYQDVKVKSHVAKEEQLLASGSKNLPTEGDEQMTPNLNQTEELPTINTELLQKKSIKVFDNVHNKVELDKKRKSDHFGQVINVIKLEESQEEEEEQNTKPITKQQGSGSQSDFDDLEFADASSEEDRKNV